VNSDILEQYETNRKSEDIFRGQSIRDIFADTCMRMIANMEVEEAAAVTDGDLSKLSNWVVLHTRNPKAEEEPFSFDGREYCIDIMNDSNQRVAVKKAAQMGVSEIMVRECLARLVTFPATKALYAFPTYEDVQFFSDTRIGPILEKSPTIKRLNRKTDNQSRKRLGDSFLMLRGATDYRHAQMLDVDWLFIDEYDRHKESIIPSLRERMGGSRYQFERDFSTPSLSGLGVDRIFELSDKKEWHDICWSCDHEEVIWEDHIQTRERDEDLEYYYACSKCGAEYYDKRRKGIWKATAKSALGISGYHISQFMSPTISAKQMVVAKELTPIPQDYQNLKLGLAVEGGMSQSDMAYGKIGSHAASLDSNMMGEAVMAVDWGSDWSWAEVSIPVPESDDRMVIWIECFHSERPSDHPKRMVEVALRTGAGYVIADMGYGQSQAEHMREMLGDKFFTIMTNSDGLIDPRFEFKRRHVVWGKLRCVESHFGLLRQNRVIIPCESPLIELSKNNKKPAHEVWIEHHKNIKIRQSKEIRQVQGAAPVQKVIEAAGPIHLGITSAYADTFYQYLHKKREIDKMRRNSGFRARII
jgi:hypothetical protein